MQRLLSTKPVVLIGLLSYPLYLWHWPLLAYANYLRFEPLGVSTRLTLVAASVAAAAFSYVVVEQPVRRRSFCRSRGSIFATMFVGTSVLLAAGIFVHFENGMRERFSNEVLRAADSRDDKNPQRRLRHDVPLGKLRLGLPRLGNVEDRRPPLLAVIGDSHADALMPLLDAMCLERDIPAVAATRSGTIPLFCGDSEPDYRQREFQNIIRERLENETSIRHVLLVARWAHHNAEVMNIENLRRTTNSLTAAGKTVWLFRQVPENRSSLPRVLALSLRWNRDVSPAVGTFAEYLQDRVGNDSLLTEVAGDRIVVLDPLDVFYPDGKIGRVVKDGRPFYVDDDHLSAFGAMQLKPIFEPMFETLSAERSGNPGHD